MNKNKMNKSILGIVISSITLALSCLLVVSMTYSWFVVNNNASTSGITLSTGNIDASYKVYKAEGLSSTSWTEVNQNKDGSYDISLGIPYPSKYQFFRVDILNNGSYAINILSRITSYTSSSSETYYFSDYVELSCITTSSVETDLKKYSKENTSLTFTSFSTNNVSNVSNMVYKNDGLAKDNTISFVFSVYISEECPAKLMDKEFKINGINFVLSV